MCSARENFGPHPFLSGHTHYFGVRAEIPTTTSEIYGPKLSGILGLCLSHTPICAIELYSGTLLLNQAIQDRGPNFGTVPDIPGQLATMILIVVGLASDYYIPKRSTLNQD